MKKTHSTVLSSLVLSGAVFIMAPQAWSQTGGPSGTGPSPSGAQKADPPASGTSSQRGTSGSGSSDMQTQREPGSSSSRAASGRHMSKENVKQVQAALKSKGVDPGPEDGVLGPKTQQAIRDFQKSNNLSVTGRLDDKTASALGVDVAGSGSGMGSSSSPSGSSSGLSKSGSDSATGKGPSDAGIGSGSSGASQKSSSTGTSSSGSATGTEPPGSGLGAPGTPGAKSKGKD